SPRLVCGWERARPEVALLRATRTVLLIALLGVASQAAAGGSSGPPQRTHVVRTGENLTRIAAATGVSVGDLVRLNHLRDQNRIVIGQRLVLPAPHPPPKPLPARLLRHPEPLAFRTSLHHSARAAYYRASAWISRIGLLTETRQYVATVLAFRPFFAG